APGSRFVYEFTVPDAGTYWYHPHLHSAEQVGRGLAGPFIIEERDPMPVDRDVVWVLGDFRLKKDGSIAGGVNTPMETAIAGGRRLAGPFIIEERDPMPVDRDVVWVLGDFRLKKDGSIAGGFNTPMETAMSGRIGNTVTINGRVTETFPVKSGERVRLRLINAA